jgi:hypothetical protein
VAFGLLAAAPYFIWCAAVKSAFGYTVESVYATNLTPMPFWGIQSHINWLTEDSWGQLQGVEQLRTFVLPGVILLGVAAWSIVRSPRTPLLWNLALQGVVFVVFASPLALIDWTSSIRRGPPMMLAAVAALPIIDASVGRRRGWLLLCAGLWLTPFELFRPFFAFVHTQF